MPRLPDLSPSCTRLVRHALALALIAPLSLAGCGAQEAPSGAGAKEPAKAGAAAPAAAGHAHDHTAPHGGEIQVLGAEEGHLEIMHDHDGGNIGFYVYGPTIDKPIPVARPVLTVQSKDGPIDVPLTPVGALPDGTAPHWKAQTDALKCDPWDGRVRLTFGGKTFQAPLEGEGHAHK